MANDNDFADELAHIKNAEEAKERTIENAKKEADKISSKASADALKIREKANQKSIEAEKEILEIGRNDIAKEEKAIISKAEKESQKIISEGIPKKSISKALKSIIEVLQ